MAINTVDGQPDNNILIGSNILADLNILTDGFSRYGISAFTDPLTSLSHWYAPTWAIAAGKVINTPTLGAETVTNGELTTDANGWSANAVFTLTQADSTTDPGTVSPSV